MGTSTLKLYNGALKILGEPRLSSTSEEREPRRALDDVYDDALALCLEEGQWWFARREAEISPDGTAPSFGFQYRFAKPADWVRTMAVSADEFFTCALEDASDQPTWWYANVNPLYVAYVSNNTSYGMLLTNWPPTFTRFVEYELAERICLQVTQSDAKYQEVMKMKIRAKRDALNKDAMGDFPKRIPSGSIVRSRMIGNESYAGHYRSGTYWR